MHKCYSVTVYNLRELTTVNYGLFELRTNIFFFQQITVKS